jgi:outer membrane immunogenic protein
MRRVMLSLVGLIFAGDAIAADYLRGSSCEAPCGYSWSGSYVGGQAGYANASMDFSNAMGSLLARLARATFLQVPDADFNAGTGFQVSKWLSGSGVGASGTTYGGFAGYNVQWGDVVIGGELNYSRTSLTGTTTDSVSRAVTWDDYRYLVTATASASAHVTDLATARLRVGYAAGWLMPYAFGALAFGRGDYTKTASIGYPAPDDLDPVKGRPPAPGWSPTPITEAKTGVVSIGYALGGGFDVGLFPGFFIRGEYEFLQLSNIGGSAIGIHNLRTAAAIKF